jgi:hypothetical protein
MSISYCHGCKVEAVDHDIYNCSKNVSRYYINEHNIWHWNCNHCGYKSLRKDHRQNTPQFYPIVPKGKPLPNNIPEIIRKDYDEARLVANYSIRCGNVLLRTCVEKICRHIVEQFYSDQLEAYDKLKTLHSKLEYIKTNVPFIDEHLHNMLRCIKEYGNDIHGHKKIEDSDTPEAFADLQEFVEEICKEVAIKIARREKASKRLPKPQQKAH